MLVEIDPATGAAALIGEIGDTAVEGQCGRIPDLTYNPTTRTLFGYADMCDGGVSDADGLVATFVGLTGFIGGGNGLAREPATGTLFATPDDDLSIRGAVRPDGGYEQCA